MRRGENTKERARRYNEKQRRRRYREKQRRAKAKAGRANSGYWGLGLGANLIGMAGAIGGMGILMSHQPRPPLIGLPEKKLAVITEATKRGASTFEKTLEYHDKIIALKHADTVEIIIPPKLLTKKIIRRKVVRTPIPPRVTNVFHDKVTINHIDANDSVITINS